jgi:hypothetical protein
MKLLNQNLSEIFLLFGGGTAARVGFGLGVNLDIVKKTIFRCEGVFLNQFRELRHKNWIYIEILEEKIVFIKFISCGFIKVIHL